MASPLTVWSSTADGRVTSSSTTYSSARGAAGTKATDDASSYTSIGQSTDGTTYYCRESFVSFNTATIGSGSTVTVATLSLYRYTDNDVIGFTMNARLFDWGGSITSADWRSGDPADSGSLDEYTLLATKSTTPNWSASDYNDFTSESAFLTNIAQTGTTYIILSSSRHEAGNAPTSGQDEYLLVSSANYSGTDQDPKLYVEYTSGATTYTGLILRHDCV